MGLIARAIEKKLHICGNKKLEEQTWEEFREQCIGKQIFIFGTGVAIDYFFRNCCNHMKIAGVIDSDKQKQGQKLGWHCAEAWQTEYETIIIQSPDILKMYSPQDVVVLITSTNYYQPIAKQLEEMKITNFFSMLLMEVNARKNSKIEQENLNEIRTDYVNWCYQQKIIENKIVMSYGEYGGHAKYITKKLLQAEKQLDIVWLVYDEQVEVPDGVRLVPEKNWKRYAYELETAKIWLFDIAVLDYIIKRPEQIYIQAKHWSSITLKKFYLDDKSSCASDEVISWIKYNGEIMDYLLSGSTFDEESCRSGFAFKGQAVRIGSARSDILFDEKIKEKVYKHFGLDLNAHVLLYAPTYRHKEFVQSRSMSVSLDINTLLDTVKKKFGGEWYIFIRLHPFLSFDKCNVKESENIINAGDYSDSEELVAASDMMITDYSSIMFEEAFVKRPVFLYAPDRKEYIDGERGLLLDYDTLPFPIAESNEELMQCIINYDRQKYEREVTNFLDKYEVHEDGHASERAADFILGLLEQE